jgi:hypothetical protein
MRLKNLMAAALAAGCGWPPPCADNGVTQRQILTGQNITLQGGKNDYGVAVQEGIALFNSVNAQGGVGGRLVVRKRWTMTTTARMPKQTPVPGRQHKVFMFGSIEGGPSTARWT